MPTTPSPAQSVRTARTAPLRRPRHRSRQGAVGPQRRPPRPVRRGFFLLPDEEPAEFLRHEALWLAAWRPRDLHEHQAAEAAIRCMWREERADRLEAVVLTDLFAAGKSARPGRGARPPRRWPSRRWARCCAIAAGSSASTAPPWRPWKACASAASRVPWRDRSEPEPALPTVAPPPAAVPDAAVPIAAVPASPHAATAAPRSEPEPAPALNRHQRRALAAMDRRRAA